MNILMAPMSTLLYMFLILSSLMAMSSNNWLMAWISLEINMLSFIPLINNSNKFQETEAMLKYFMIQSIGSSMLLMSSSTLWMLNTNNFYISTMLMVSLLMKLGMAPCHMWFPSVMSSMSWMSCMILSTWQKLAPLSIIVFLYIKLTFMMLIPIINAVIGSMMGMNQTKLKSIMAFSSITHMGWMMSFTMIYKPMFSIMYLMMYSIIIIPTFMFMMKNMMISTAKKITTMNTVPLIILLLSLSGIPPFMGFVPKWMTIYMLYEYKPMMILLITGSIMNLFFYLNIMFPMIIQQATNKLISTTNMTKFTLMATCTLPVMIMMALYAMTLLDKS